MVKQHVIIRKASTDEDRYKATVQRDTDKFPMTDAGDFAFRQACIGGGFLVTAENGCTIPAGTRPTLTIPDCSTPPDPDPGPGTGLTPGYGNVYEPNTNFVELGELNRSGSGEEHGQYNRVYLGPTSAGNGATIGVNLRIAGIVDYFSVPGAYNGKNLINSPIYGNGNVDAGRQAQQGHYGWPNGAGDEFYDPATGQTSRGIGFQPLEGGNEGQDGDYANLLVFHKSNGLIYTKVQPFHWDMKRVPAQMHMEKWIKRDPNDNYAFRWHMRWRLFRTDPQSNAFPGGFRTHEIPCFMLNPDFNEIMFATGKPYTGNWQTVQSEVGPDKGGQFRSTEPFMIALDNRTGKGVAIYTPHSGRYGHNRDTRGWDTGTDRDFPVFYLASTPNLVCDKNGVYDFDFAHKYGTVDELKAWCYAQPRWPGTFDYVFNQHSRYGWFYNHAGDQLEQNITEYIEVVPVLYGDQQGRDMKFSSPEVWINGEVVKKIYIDADFVNGATQMKIVWSKPDSPGTERKYTFTITPNQGRKTYTVDMSNVDGWNNSHMLGFAIQYDDPTAGQYPNIDGVKWKIYRIYSGQ